MRQSISGHTPQVYTKTSLRIDDRRRRNKFSHEEQKEFVNVEQRPQLKKKFPLQTKNILHAAEQVLTKLEETFRLCEEDKSETRHRSFQVCGET